MTRGIGCAIRDGAFLELRYPHPWIPALREGRGGTGGSVSMEIFGLDVAECPSDGKKPNVG